jgi:alpha/beta superfamily hydrolase
MRKIEQIYLKNRTIFATIYLPIYENDNKEVVIMCPPIYQERAWSERVCHNFLEYTSKAGYFCGNLHYFGVGDSEGESEDMTVETMVDDICSLIEYFVDTLNIKKINLLGFRFGSIIASLVLKNYKINKMVFWAPILNADKYLTNMLKMCLSTQSVMFREIKMNRKQIISSLLDNESTVVENYAMNNIYGYRFSKDFYLQAQKINLLQKFDLIAKEFLIADINPGGTNTKEVLLFTEKLQNDSNIPITLKVVNEKRFWINEKHYKSYPLSLFNTTLSWLNGKTIF